MFDLIKDERKEEHMKEIQPLTNKLKEIETEKREMNKRCKEEIEEKDKEAILYELKKMEIDKKLEDEMTELDKKKRRGSI